MRKTQLAINTVIILTLCSCSVFSSYRERANELNIGDNQEKVVSVMSSPINSTSFKGVELWQYESISSLGVCEYHEFWFWKGKLFDHTVYNNGSISGCEIGRREVNWSNALEKLELNNTVEESDIASTSKGESLIDELERLSALHKAKEISDEEYKLAKQKLLSN